MTVTRLSHEDFDWASGAGGAAEVRRIAAEAAASDHREALNEAAQLTLQNHNLDTAVLLLATPGTSYPGVGEGFAYLHGLYGSGRPELDLVVAPKARRQGLGRRLAQEVLELVGGIPVTAWSHGDHPAATALAMHLGFARVRELWLMRRPSSIPLPPVGEFDIRPFRSGDEETFLAVNAAAFADHPEQGSLDRRGLDERMAEPWFDADGFLVGEVAGEVAGFHWTKVHRPDDAPAHGEVYVIGVHPRAQGTGLGRALLVAGLEHLHAAHLDEVVLYVEGDNEGAIRLYESFGFTHAPEDTDVLYATID